MFMLFRICFAPAGCLVQNQRLQMPDLVVVLGDGAVAGEDAALGRVDGQISEGQFHTGHPDDAALREHGAQKRDEQEEEDPQDIAGRPSSGLLFLFAHAFASR